MSDSPIPGLTNEQVAALLAQFMAEKMGPQKPKTPFRDLWAAYAVYGSSITDGGRPRIRSWPSYITAAKYLLPFFGDLPWDQVTLMKCEEYRALARTWVSKKTRRGLCGATINRQLRGVQSCLSFCVKRGLIPTHPLRELEDEPVLKTRDFAITREQFLELLRQARPQLRHMLIMYYETGCRRDEIRRLEWPDVDIEAGFITIPAEKAKNGKAREIPLTTTARMILEMIPRDPVNTYVFANPHGPRGPVGRQTLQNWWEKAREDAGVHGPKGQKIWIHTLRHTWATDGITSGIDIETLMSVGGWSDVRTMRLYMNISRRHRETMKTQLSARSADLQGMLVRPGRIGAKATAPKRVSAKRAEEQVPEVPDDDDQEDLG